MAVSPLEKARYRKLFYLGLILLLFTGLVIFRQLGVVESAAQRYGISETNIGKTDLGNSAARHLLVSFRGLLICSLWWEAIDLQMRHEWHEMEIIIKSLTKLQPHFRSTWEYQGWNLAYNVSVEFDRAQDKYFYVAEGIRWTASGERINRAVLYDPDAPNPPYKRVVGDPNLRWSAGFFLQDKFSVSDEIATYRCFLPLSCIPPKEWDPYGFRQDPQRLKDFKRDHPQLVQRIRILKHIPEEAEAQLDEELKNFTAGLFKPEFPSLHPEDFQRGAAAFPLDRVADLPRFPVWPVPDPEEAIPEGLREALRNIDPLKPKSQDSYEISRLWFEYSLVPLPPASLDVGSLSADRRRLYRMPQRMLSAIFRSNPARSKSLMAMRLAREGWFEESRQAWSEAFEMWRDHGRAIGLEVDPTELEALQVRARRFAQRFPEVAMGSGAEVPFEAMQEEEVKRDYVAFRRIENLNTRQGIGNYSHWRITSEANMSPLGVQAWRHFYNAQHRYKSDLRLARAEYEKGLECWRQLMSTNKVRAESLLGLGGMGLNLGGLLQSRPCFEPTPFGLNKQTHEEIAPIQLGYIGTRARCDAPRWLQASCDLWQLSQLWTHQASSAGAQFGPLGCLPAPAVPTSLAQAQLMLEMLDAPLDLYLDDTIVNERSAARTRVRPSPGEPGQEPDSSGKPKAGTSQAPEK